MTQTVTLWHKVLKAGIQNSKTKKYPAISLKTSRSFFQKKRATIHFIGHFKQKICNYPTWSTLEIKSISCISSVQKLSESDLLLSTAGGASLLQPDVYTYNPNDRILIGKVLFWFGFLGIHDTLEAQYSLCKMIVGRWISFFDGKISGANC